MPTAQYFWAWIVRLLVLLAAFEARAETEELLGLNFGPLPSREVRVYLPPGGVTPTTPILIALDGQQMKAWRLEEGISGLAAKGGWRLPLVVAIAASTNRIEEYGLAGALDYAGRGRQAGEFQRFVVDVVLPAVRIRYAIRANPKRTGVMGSSLGGLAAFDLAWRHSKVFGFAGIFSGSLWWRGDDSSPAARQESRLVHRMVRQTPRRPQLRLWFEAGTRDEASDRDGNGIIDAIQDTTELLTELERRGFRRGTDLEYLELDGGQHSETTWARALPTFLEWTLPQHWSRPLTTKREPGRSSR